MTKLPAWHRDATAPKAKTPKGRAMWATVADRYDSDPRDPNSVHALAMYDPYTPDPDMILPDGTGIDFNTLPQGTYSGKLTAKGAEKIIAGLEKKLDPKRCIAAGGRMRCMDCRCGKPSPKNVTQERMPDYGTKSGHGRKKDNDKIPRRFRCIEDPSAGLLRMIGNKRALTGGPHMAEGEDE